MEYLSKEKNDILRGLIIFAYLNMFLSFLELPSYEYWTFVRYATTFSSLYVLYVSFTSDNIADGWASISLQLSLMFFLISSVLMILGEYVLKMTRLSNQGPSYLISREFTSQTIDIQETLNIESLDP